MGINKLPEKLTMLRKYQGYSQGDIAGKLGVSVQEYMNWENGNSICSIYQLVELSKILKIDVQTLVDNTKTITLSNGKSLDDSVAIPFQRKDENATEDINFENANLYENDSQSDMGRTRVMGTESFRDTENVETVEEENQYHHHHQTNHSNKNRRNAHNDKKKKQTIIIGSVVGAVVLVILLIILFTRGSSSSITLSTTNRLAVGDTYSMYIDKDGKFKVRGNANGTSNFKDLVQVSAYDSHALGLTNKGEVVSNDDADVSSWEGVTMIAAGANHSVALKSDGTVYCTGNENACQVSDWANIKSVYAGNGYTIGLKSDGSLAVAGEAPSGLSEATGIGSVAVGNNQVILIDTKGKATSYATTGNAQDVSSWENISVAAVGNNISAGVTSSGTVVAVCDDEEMQSTIQSWNNIRYIAANGNTIIAIDKSGNMHGAGDNTYNQYENQAQTSTASASSDKLSSPKDLKVTTNTGNVVISWSKVSNVDYYEVTVDTDPTTTNKTTSTSVSISTSEFTEEQTYTISVVAYPKDENKYSKSDPSTLTFTYTPETIQLNSVSDVKTTVSADGSWTFEWNRIDHADYYEVSFNGDTAQQVEDTAFYINSGMVDGNKYGISIKACSYSANYTDSNAYENEFTYFLPYTVTIYFDDGTNASVRVKQGEYTLADLLKGTDYESRVTDETKYNITESTTITGVKLS